MVRCNLRTLILAAVMTLTALFTAPPLRAQDSVTVGSVTASGSNVQVPVYVRDASGTPLGSDAGAGKRIQGLSFQVNYSPASSVSSLPGSVTFTRSGITQSLTPVFENSPPGVGSIGYLATFSETTQPIPFTLNAGGAGDEVARLTFTLSPSAAPNSTITLTLDSGNTLLSNQASDVSEVPPAGLVLVNGAITIPPLTLTLGPSGQTIQKDGVADFMLTTSSAVGASTSVTLSSSSPGVVQVPATATIAAGNNFTFFRATGLAAGGPVTITATLPQSLGGGQASVTTSVIMETIPTAPSSPFPVDGAIGVTMPVGLRWSSDGSYQYHVFFGTDPDPRAFTTTNINGVLVTTVAGTKYYWRVEASNSAGTTSSPVWSFTTLQTTQCRTPPAPTLTAPDTASSGQPFQLSWTTAADATEYQVDESSSTSFASVNTTTVTAPATTLTITKTVAADTMFYYRVRGRNGGTCNLSGPNSTSRLVLVLVRPARPASLIIPVVGSVQGNGAIFKTAVQLLNPTAGTISGKIIFHKAGASGSDADPSLVYTLGPNKAVSYADVLPEFAQSGLGSADLVVSSGTAPLSVIRIFATGNFAGTAGMTQDSISADEALKQGETGILIAPADVTAFRFNIGVRTLASGASLTIAIRNKDGVMTRTLTKNFAANFFSQVESSQFLGAPLNGTDSIYFSIASGTAIIYGATTDNASQDPSLQIARRPK